jgi:transposase-like protein
MKKRQPWTDQRRAEVVRLYRDGLTQYEVAQALGTSQGKVYEALIRMKEPTRGDGRFSTERCSGARNAQWKGGRTIDKDGYVLVHTPNHPHANSGGYVREHRLAMEKELGRFLLPSEVCHHKRSDERANNSPENLELFPTNGEHLKFELQGRVPNWSPEGKARLASAARKPRGPRKHAGQVL